MGAQPSSWRATLLGRRRSADPRRRCWPDAQGITRAMTAGAEGDRAVDALRETYAAQERAAVAIAARLDDRAGPFTS
jgi:spore germination cell wall hydrolase CwlJ-like protein